MTSDEIKNVVKSAMQEVLDDFLRNVHEEITAKLKKYADENGKIDAIKLGIFAYTQALTDSVQLNTEIMLNALIKLFADN